jgi:hypothetical protein
MFRVLFAPIIRSSTAAYSHRYLYGLVCLFHWSRYWFWDTLAWSVTDWWGKVLAGLYTPCKTFPHQSLTDHAKCPKTSTCFIGTNTPNHTNTYGCTLQFCSWWWVQIALETCRANVVKKEIKNIVHLVVLELNVYVLKVITTNTLLYCITMNYLPGVMLNVHRSKNVWIKALMTFVFCVVYFF